METSLATLFVAAATRTPTWVGISRKPERDLARLERRAARILFEHKLPTLDAAQYVERLMLHRLIVEGASQDAGGWWVGLHANEIVDIAREIMRLFERGPTIKPAREAMRSLRVGTFQVSMSTLAELAGVSTSQVSRWESGDQIPDYTALARLRLHAIEAGIAWPKSFPITLSDARLGSSNVVPFRARGRTHGEETTSKRRRG